MADVAQANTKGIEKLDIICLDKFPMIYSVNTFNTFKPMIEKLES